MANHFHSGGEAAYARAQEHELRKAIKAKHADALSNASWLERLLIRFEMWREFSQTKRENPRPAHTPSPYTLW